MALTLTPLVGIPMIHEGDDLSKVILAALQANDITLQDGDILVLAQKIVSKAEGRLENLAEVSPSESALELAEKSGKDPRLVEVIVRESREVLRVKPGTIIVEHRLGFVCASAGVDHSNASLDPQLPPPGSMAPNTEDAEWVLLLPEDPDASAQALCNCLETISGVKLGVMIIDSHGRAWRLGTVGVVIGLAGVPGLVDLRGQVDLFGYPLKITVIGAADELAAAASLVMGQAAEGTPVVHVRGFPYPLRQSSLSEMLRPRQEDLFR
jgi:coenzyme F420-0:L-glutamate ligase / coenzyme F420-1:gamma-L-glutamate ligase